MLLDKYLPRTAFSSYEDFIENYRVITPESFNFGFDVVDEWARTEPCKRALLWCDDHGEEKTFTFADMSRLSNRAANFFASLGIRKGSVVLLILRRRWEYWACATALHKLGAVLIPGSVQLTRKDIAYRANAAHVQAVVALDDDFVCAQLLAARGDAPDIEHLILANGSREGFLSLSEGMDAASEDFKRPTGEDAPKSADVMLMYFTSGTTGMPKMVCHNYLYPLGHIVTAKYWQQVEENQLHMSVSDSGWAKFGWGKIYGQWLCGACVFAWDMEKFVPARLLAMIEKYRVRTFCAPVTMYRFMLQEDVSRYDLSNVAHFCIAGEPLNPEVFERWKELTGKALCEGFGQSESTVLIANFPWFAPRPGSTGKPAPLYNVQLLSDEGLPCEDGEEGEIVLAGVQDRLPPGLFCGYSAGDGARYAPHAGDYNLKDVAWRDSDGYYWFVGRHDDVIKCSGYRIGPFEVESALISHPAVVECAITGAPDPIRGQVVKATVVLAAGYQPSDALVKELQNHVKRVTAPYKYPRVVEFVAELPKTLGGKIKRAQLRAEAEK